LSEIEESNAQGFHGAASEQTEQRPIFLQLGFDLGPNNLYYTYTTSCGSQYEQRFRRVFGMLLRSCLAKG